MVEVGLAHAWSATRAYGIHDVVIHAGRAWVARRSTRGERPGDGVGLTWLMLVDPAAPAMTDKATMAQALDERIGRGA